MSKNSPTMSFEMWLQSRLTAHGYAPGVIDGIVGPNTIAAIKAFEKTHGLPVDGKADEVVVKALRASASAIPPIDMTKIPNRDEDPDEASPGKTTFPRQKDVLKFFGPVGQNQTRVEVPFDMVLAWDTSKRVRAMTLHLKVAESASRALEKISEVYSEDERRSLGLHLWGGSLNVRRMRGGKRYSMHSWGIAIDFDPQRNALRWGRDRARLAEDDAVPFWQAWESEGWCSLGRLRNFDWMHVQAARL
ncbi:peptidoglycan-binding protein [Hoeflea poritis]|uniref:Peptidoglycan-binding protein n=1 Tax=Hoeflea poritis TaxID=2993659 RepID=A0ABT4VMM4_9HYPH|nr:peptidoglycan-binding protein [Hoeflea poritis]MDA4845972.1 peptidoglycan-binding protein [Hoeflea poritis]